MTVATNKHTVSKLMDCSFKRKRLNCKLCETFLLYDLGQPYKQERLSLTYKVTGWWNYHYRWLVEFPHWLLLFQIGTNSPQKAFKLCWCPTLWRGPTQMAYEQQIFSETSGGLQTFWKMYPPYSWERYGRNAYGCNFRSDSRSSSKLVIPSG